MQPGLPQSGWWYDPAANDNVGYFLGISTQPQADGGVAHIGDLAVLAYDPSGRQVWQTAQATFDGTDRARITLPSGGCTTLARFGV